MSKKKTGGSAFPVAGYQEINGYVLPTTGMTLRDYFAGQALAGAMASSKVWKTDEENIDTPERYAVLAYNIADAMIVEKAGLKTSFHHRRVSRPRYNAASTRPHCCPRVWQVVRR